MDSYLFTMKTLVERQKKHLNAYSENAEFGRFVTGKIEEIRTKHAIVKTEDGDLGLVEGKFEKNDQVKGHICWIDGPEQMIYIHALKSVKSWFFNFILTLKMDSLSI